MMTDPAAPLVECPAHAVLGIFAKQPAPGEVKTRLAAVRGDAWAAELYSAFVADIVERFRATADRRFVSYWPDCPEAAAWFVRVVQGHFDLCPQPDAPLGERLEAFFRMAFASGARRVVVIGSDSPTLPRDYVERAFELLDGDHRRAESPVHGSPRTDVAAPVECVLGPAADGGYYLMGLRERLLPVFRGIEWSTPRVLSQTVARLSASGASLALLPPWYDVDSPEDIELLRGHLDGLRAMGAPIPARTAAIVRAASCRGPAPGARDSAESPPGGSDATIAASRPALPA
jgi:uncharacterized protein